MDSSRPQGIHASRLAGKLNLYTTKDTGQKSWVLQTVENEFLPLIHPPNSEVAEELLSYRILRAEAARLPEFYECTRAIHNWSKYILNAIDVPYANGYTEGCNNKTKVLKRVSYGVRNFARFRNRILHSAA